MEQPKPEPSKPTDSTVIIHRTGNELEYTAIPLDRNTILLAETANASSINCGESVKKLVHEYLDLLKSKTISNPEPLSIEYELGKGSQGVVYYSKCHGSDSFQLPVALKFYCPEGFGTKEKYAETMNFNAKVASAIAQIQHDSLLSVRNWFMFKDIRVMEMEWIDGYDLARLMKNSTIDWMQKNLPEDEFAFRMNVVISPGKHHPALKTGIALTIIRHCLDALSALHEHGIAHGDIKPANIMLKRTGGVKIIDYGATIFYQETPPPENLCTPLYAAPEILQDRKKRPTPLSDLSSLGYVLIELLSGQIPFEIFKSDGTPVTYEDLADQKITLIHRLNEILPNDVQRNSKLVNCLTRLIHPDLNSRFQSAKEAIVSEDGISEIYRSLVKGDLVSEYDEDIKYWIRSLRF
ncbi:MAG: serine/threonine protein kinase [Thermoguttaceae bacterium]|nr:serine/threonine protein kinase [Thermoguttaceae bacterium]